MSISKVTPPTTAVPFVENTADAPLLSVAEFNLMIDDLLRQGVSLPGSTATFTQSCMPPDLRFAYDPDDDDEYEADEDVDDDDDEDYDGDDDEDDFDDDEEGDFDEDDDDYADEDAEFEEEE